MDGLWWNGVTILRFCKNNSLLSEWPSLGHDAAMTMRMPLFQSAPPLSLSAKSPTTSSADWGTIHHPLSFSRSPCVYVAIISLSLSSVAVIVSRRLFGGLRLRYPNLERLVATDRRVFPEGLAAADAGAREGGVRCSVAHLGVRRDSVDGGTLMRVEHVMYGCSRETRTAVQELWCVQQGHMQRPPAVF